MSYEIIEASPEAKAKITSYDDVKQPFDNDHYRSKYPFDALKIGQCFTVLSAEANENSIRLTATNRGKKSGKKFTVIKHKDFKLIEVARIA